MPLEKKSSDSARSRNIGKLVKEGKDKKQAAAIAYRIQKNAKKDKK